MVRMDLEGWNAKVDELLPEIVDLRHKLHKCAELSDHEVNTASTICSFLSKYNLSPLAFKVAGNGLLVRVCGAGEISGGAVVFRSDMDALQLIEETGVSYSAYFTGHHHACGHDGHMAMLAGALAILARNKRLWQGEIIGLFQPAEETGHGAMRMLEDERVQALRVKRVFAVHNIPGLPIGTMGIRNGTMACASRGIHIQLQGIRSHASEPHLGRNPIPAIARLALEVPSLPDVIEVQDRSVSLGTLVQLDCGGPAYGTSAGLGHLRCTLRGATDADVVHMRDHLAREARNEAEAGGFVLSMDEHDVFPATINNTDACEIAVKAAGVAGLSVFHCEKPFKWSEDVGYFTDRWTGALLALGAGDIPPLHTKTYDFPDAAIVHGLRLWIALATQDFNH